MMNSKMLVVGAGFAGSVCARQLAEAGYQVTLIEKRSHIGGNAYDEYDSHGVLIHPYGPHLFHTNSPRIFEWLSRFTQWRNYEHRVLAHVNGKDYPIPINKITINELYGLNLDEQGVADFLHNVRIEISTIKNSEDLVLSSVGHDLCEKFFRGYTKKQWGMDLSELSAGVAARIPVRVNDDDRYFSDKFQAIPSMGYTKMFENILNHPNINLKINCSYKKISNNDFHHTIYTGPIDEFFGYEFGCLPYRSLRFEHEHYTDVESFQSAGTVNYPNDHHYTRITEFKKITGQQHSGTSIVKEFPVSTGDPFYPVPTSDNELLYQKYLNIAISRNDVTFVGRLAQYRYYNMDQVVAAALKAMESFTLAGESS